MKKIFIILALLPMLAFADDCANAYKAGLDLYKQGKYAEAQLKFVAVAKNCGDYADVWNKLKSCNQKLAEKQSQQSAQIASLKAEIQGLEQATNQSPNNVSSATLSKDALDIVKNINAIKSEAQQSKEQLKTANDSITSLNKQLKGTNATNAELQEKIESLKKEIEELKKPVSTSEEEKEKVSHKTKVSSKQKSNGKSQRKKNKNNTSKKQS